MIEFFLKKKLFLFTIIIFNFLIISNIYISPYFYILSLLVIFFNVFPLINFYYKYKEINYIPLFYFTHIYFFCCYSLAIFFPETIINIFDNSSFRNAISNGNLETTVISLIQKKKLFINALEIYVIGLVFFNFGNYIVKIAISDKTKKNVYL